MTTESNVRSDPRGTPPRSGLDAYFHISERGSTIEREIRGGFATFFTMAYIVVLNPLILGGAQDVNGQRLDLGQLTTATALVAAAMTLLMGVYGRYPFAIAAVDAHEQGHGRRHQRGRGRQLAEVEALAVDVLGAAEDQRVEDDDVGHGEEGGEPAADLPLDRGAALGDVEVGVQT